MTYRTTSNKTQYWVSFFALLGDAAVTFLSLSFAYWLRFNTEIKYFGLSSNTATYETYLPLLLLGTGFLILTFSYLGLYTSNLALHRHRTYSTIVRGTFFWIVAFISISLVLKFEPQISRVFVSLSLIVTMISLFLWRSLLLKIIVASPISTKLQKRVVIYGLNEETVKLYETMAGDTNHPYDPIGVITAIAVEAKVKALQRQVNILGSKDDLEKILVDNRIDILIIATADLSRKDTAYVTSTCEKHYVSYKIVPTAFQIFLSGLHLQTVAGTPLLGVEDLPLQKITNRLAKRAIDIIGGTVGLIGSAPIILLLAILIKRESKGPIFYLQTRTGEGGKDFSIIKLRSMKMDAEAGTGAQWCVEDDPRRTKIGTFMRETNLDEIPQFWNVLKGDMSLVGPRPERPELISKFIHEIPHYQVRHSVKPGITGWAQIHGLRGNTSLEERIRYDIFYIENWSLWTDVYSMVMTFFKRQNAY